MDFNFALKNVGFSVLVSFAVCSFQFFSIWCSPFGKNISGFSDVVPDVVFSFSNLDSGSLLRLICV